MPVKHSVRTRQPCATRARELPRTSYKQEQSRTGLRFDGVVRESFPEEEAWRQKSKPALGMNQFPGAAKGGMARRDFGAWLPEGYSRKIEVITDEHCLYQAWLGETQNQITRGREIKERKALDHLGGYGGHQERDGCWLQCSSRRK